MGPDVITTLRKRQWSLALSVHRPDESENFADDFIRAQHPDNRHRET